MNYNKFVKFPEINQTINDRAKLDTGTACNYKCKFCYYIDKLDVVTPFKTIKERIDYLKTSGVTEVDLSGGESSIHADWFKILDYCNDLGLRTSTLSNGSKFKNEDFLIRSKKHGLKEILFSVHGNEDYHNGVVQRKNAFRDIQRAIQNALNNDVIVRVNCTVTEETTLDFLLELDPRISQVNFLPINYWASTKKGKNDFQQICDKIIPFLEKLRSNHEVNVRYIPFCYMPNHTEHIVDIYQHIFDKRDWNIALYDMDINAEDYKKDPKKYLIEAAKRKILHFHKPKECFKCKYFNVCDGVKYKGQEVFPK